MHAAIRTVHRSCSIQHVGQDSVERCGRLWPCDLSVELRSQLFTWVTNTAGAGGVAFLVMPTLEAAAIVLMPSKPKGCVLVSAGGTDTVLGFGVQRRHGWPDSRAAFGRCQRLHGAV